MKDSKSYFQTKSPFPMFIRLRATRAFLLFRYEAGHALRRRLGEALPCRVLATLGPGSLVGDVPCLLSTEQLASAGARLPGRAASPAAKPHPFASVVAAGAGGGDDGPLEVLVFPAAKVLKSLEARPELLGALRRKASAKLSWLAARAVPPSEAHALGGGEGEGEGGGGGGGGGGGNEALAPAATAAAGPDSSLGRDRGGGGFVCGVGGGAAWGRGGPENEEAAALELDGLADQDPFQVTSTRFRRLMMVLTMTVLRTIRRRSCICFCSLSYPRRSPDALHFLILHSAAATAAAAAKIK